MTRMRLEDSDLDLVIGGQAVNTVYERYLIGALKGLNPIVKHAYMSRWVKLDKTERILEAGKPRRWLNGESIFDRVESVEAAEKAKGDRLAGW